MKVNIKKSNPIKIEAIINSPKFIVITPAVRHVAYNDNNIDNIIIIDHM